MTVDLRGRLFAKHAPSDIGAHVLARHSSQLLKVGTELSRDAVVLFPKPDALGRYGLFIWTSGTQLTRELGHAASIAPEKIDYPLDSAHLDPVKEP